MNSHTPGPWRIWRDQDPKEPLSVVGQSEDFTCQIAMENTNAKANAKLISAAPELLEALRALAESVEHDYQVTFKRELAIARAAIAKAT